jgi:hypothetical protein
MPRYRFRWELLPQAVAVSLAANANISGDPLDGLRRRYGARPRSDFVKDQWTVLRDNWLADDATARGHVIHELRQNRLGDWQTSPSPQTGEQTYLASCRNTASLREIVLAAFHDLGSTGPTGKPANSTTTPEPGIVVARPRERIDVNQANEAAWTDLEARLAHALETLGDGQVLLIETAPSIDDENNAAYMQYAGQGPAGIRAEFSSNTFLDQRSRLTQTQEAALCSLGWLPPTGTAAESTPESDPSGSPNYYRDFPAPVSGSGLARMAIASLRDVLGIPHPSILAAVGYATGTDAAAPDVDLGIPVLDHKPASTQPALAVMTTTATELQKLVNETIATMVGTTITHDPDGDIPIRVGSAMVFIRIVKDAPLLELFSPLLLEVDESPALMGRLQTLNRDLRFVQLYANGQTVMAAIQLFAAPFVPAHLLAALQILTQVADKHDDQLQAEFGGRQFFGEFRPPPQQSGPMTGGYL